MHADGNPLIMQINVLSANSASLICGKCILELNQHKFYFFVPYRSNDKKRYISDGNYDPHPRSDGDMQS